jgi:hypothetical protein
LSDGEWVAGMAHLESLLTRLHKVLSHTSAGWPLRLALGAFAVLGYLIACARAVPFSVPYIESHFGGTVLDVKLLYCPSEGADALTALGEEGRRHYGLFQIADVVFLLCYGMALASAVFALFRRNRLATALALLPLLTAGFDLVEDGAVFVALRTFPHPSRGALIVAAMAGTIKLAGFSGTVALLFFGVLCRLRMFVKRRLT